MRHPAVDDVRAGHAGLHRAQARLHLGHHPGVQLRQQLFQCGGVDLVDERIPVGPVGVEALHVGEHHQLRRPDALGESGGGGVGVDVVHHPVGIGGDRRYHRDPSRRNEIEYGGGLDRGHVTDEADVGGLPFDEDVAAGGGEQVRVLAGDADRVGAVRVDQTDEFAAHLPEQHHPHDVHHLGRRHPEPALEFTDEPESVQHGADLRPATVHHHRVHADRAQERHVGGEGGLEYVVDHGVAAVLDDDDVVAQLLQPRQGLGEDVRLLGRGQVGGQVARSRCH